LKCKKQQLKRGQVAPFNPNPKWPTGYFQVLEELGVEARRQPFYAHWVRQFFNRQQNRKQRRDLGRREIEAFIEEPCSKLQGMFCPTAVLRSDRKEVSHL